MATLQAGPPPAGLTDGDSVGPYRILRRIGSGGMAEVFKARRQDGVHSKSVAVKVIRQRWLGEPALEQRFRTEREILASLEHPGIARLLDGGVTATGTPYVVMEFVEGMSLGEYCQRDTVSRETRLRLFLDLCQAVEYAHRNLIVHRDLKPNNVLVTVDGQVKLLDFGIAKLLRPEVWRGGVAVTTAADRLATPEFASPEQLRGETITTASDIYSLGVLLRYILTGTLPYDVSNAEWDEAVRIVSQTEPASLRDSGLPPDLEAIIRVATRKEPGGRYASVGHLREDIERHLQHQPVRAWRGEWWYPIGRYVRRHRWAVGLAASLVLVLAGSAAALAVMNQRLSQERDTARATTDFLTDLFQTADPFAGRRSLREMLDEGARRLPSLGREPRVQAALAERIGDVYRQLGEYKMARPLAEQAVAVYERIDGPRSLDAARNMVRLADLLREQSEHARAADLAVRSLEIRRSELGRLHADVADSLNMVGILRQIQGRLKESEAAFREAVEIRRVTQPGTFLLALSLGNLGNVVRLRGASAEAEKLYREALALRRKTWGNEHPRIASSLGQIADTLLDQGKKDEALAATTEAIAILRKTLPPGHPEMPRTLLAHSSALRHNGRLTEAEAVAREAWEIQKKTRGAASVEASVAQSSVAKVLLAQNRLAEAEALVREAAEIRRKMFGPRHNLVARALEDLAEVRQRQGQASEALALRAEAKSIQAR